MRFSIENFSIFSIRNFSINSVRFRSAYLHTPQGDSTHAPAHDFSYFFIKKHIFKLRTIYYTLFTFVFTFEVSLYKCIVIKEHVSILE